MIIRDGSNVLCTVCTFPEAALGRQLANSPAPYDHPLHICAVRRPVHTSTAPLAAACLPSRRPERRLRQPRRRRLPRQLPPPLAAREGCPARSAARQGREHSRQRPRRASQTASCSFAAAAVAPSAGRGPPCTGLERRSPAHNIPEQPRSRKKGRATIAPSYCVTLPCMSRTLWPSVKRTACTFGSTCLGLQSALLVL
jgi:hypothetical protein